MSFFLLGCNYRNLFRKYFCTEALSYIEFVHLPFLHVVFNIIRDLIHFADVSHDAVMKTCLPCERYSAFVGEFRDSGFEIADSL